MKPPSSPVLSLFHEQDYLVSSNSSQKTTSYIYNLQSGTSNVSWGTLTSQKGTIEQIAMKTGCTNDDTFIHCLQEIPTAYLEQCMRDLDFIPTIDGAVLPDNPLNLIASSQMHKRDVLLGNHSEEITAIYNHVYFSVVLSQSTFSLNRCLSLFNRQI